MAQWGVLANAVINVVGNMSGWRSAMRETQTQLWGMMTLASRMGGVISQNILSPIAAVTGMQKIHAAQQRAKLAFDQAVQQHAAAKPARPRMPPSALALTNPALYNQLMAQYQQQLAAYPGAMAAWRQARPNRQQFMQQFVEQAAAAEQRMLLLSSAVLGIGRVLASASQYASNFREELNKVTQTFGQSTGAVMSWVNRMAAQGIGRTPLMSGTGTMGIELLGAGVGERMATDMATAMAQRAVDVSSLYNIDQDTAIRKFVSGLAGFGRPLKELGVIINEDRVETYAFVHGLWDGHSAITESIKVQSRYGLIMQETARATGDFTKTQYELANQYRILGGNFSNMMEELGNFAPVQGVIFTINQAMSGLQRLFSFLNNEYAIYKRVLGVPGGMDANMERWEASNRNRETTDRAYADEVIAQNFMGKGHRASHSGLADFGKRLQEGVFNDSGRQQLELTRQLVGLTEQQVALMKQLGFKNFVSPDFVPF